MATKQIIIRKYIDGPYLTILSKKRALKLIYIDLLSSFGMNKVTKLEGKESFVFPGTTISAALISNKKKSGFDEFYVNDKDYIKRKVLSDRLNALNKSSFFNTKLNYEINLEKNDIDSNKWVLEVLKKIKKENDYFHYLMVIDNEGMNVNYDTIKKIREIHNYGDFIITYQNNFVRNINNSEKIEQFFGKSISVNTKKEELFNIYIEQLHKIGLGNIEPIRILSESGFYYTLLFCCRNDVSASWLKMIEEYRTERFRNWTDDNVKTMWDIVKGHTKRLDQFWN